MIILLIDRVFTQKPGEMPGNYFNIRTRVYS